MKTTALLLFALLICAAPLRAADLRWDGGGDGTSWSDAANWSGDVVPAGGDHAIIAMAGTYRVRLTSAVSVARLTVGGSSGSQTLDASGFLLALGIGPSVVETSGVLVTGGLSGGSWQALTIEGPLQIHGRLDWTNGTISANTYYQPPNGRVITIEAGGTMRWLGSIERHIAATLDNRGTIRWEAGLTWFDQGYAHTSSGLFEIALAGSQKFARTGVNSIGPWIFANTGTIRMSGIDTVFMQVEIRTVGGTIDVQSGVYLQNYTSRWENATVSVASGATLQLAANRSHEPHTIAGTLTGNPTGTFLLSGLPGNFHSNILADTTMGGVLDIGGTGLQVGFANLGGYHGTKLARAPVNRGLMRLVGSREHFIEGEFINEDTLRWEEGTFYYANTAAFTNNAVFDMALATDALFAASGINGSRPGPFYNNGLVLKRGPRTATSTVDFFTIRGRVEVLDGKLLQEWTSRWEDATIMVTEGDTFQLAGNRGFNPHTIAGTLTSDPAGTLLLSGTSWGYHTTILADSNGGVLDIGGTGLQADNAEFGVNEGTTLRPAPVNRNLVRLVGANPKLVSGPTTNEGTLRWEQGPIQVNRTTLTNAGLFEMMPASDQEIQFDNGTIRLTGIIRKSAATKVIMHPMMNADSGTIDVREGELSQANIGYWKDVTVNVDSGAIFALNSNREFAAQTVAGTLRGTVEGMFRIGGPLSYHTNVYADSVLGGRLDIGGEGIQFVNGHLGGYRTPVPFPAPVNVGRLRFAGNTPRYIRSAFRNEGTMEWEDGDVYASSGVNVTNSGLFEISSHKHLFASEGIGTLVNEESGRIRKIDTGEAIFRFGIDNHGRLAVLGGILSVIEHHHFENFPTGTISGAGALDLHTLHADSLRNSGLTSPGPGDAGEGVGTLVIHGGYPRTALPHARFRFDLGGVDSAMYDRLILTSTGPAIDSVTADVHLVNGFQPRKGDSFDVVNGAVTGELRSVGSTPPGLAFIDIYPINIVRLIFDEGTAGEPGISVIAPVISARQGETLDIPITVVASAAARASGATEVLVDLLFNATLLVPIESTAKGIRTSDERRLSLRLPISSQDTTRAILRFRATLGNDSTTALALESARSNIAAIPVTDRDGIFRLLDLCHEGGPRLVNPAGSVAVSKLAPNPVSERLGFDLILLEKGRTRIMLADASGRLVRMLHDGEMEPGSHHIDLDIADISSGRYYIVIETPTIKTSQPVEVIR